MKESSDATRHDRSGTRGTGRATKAASPGDFDVVSDTVLDFTIEDGKLDTESQVFVA